MTRIAILDDYQGVAMQMADWDSLPDGCQVEVFHDHVADIAVLADRLRDFGIVCIMRERTPFRRDLISRLPKLKLLVTTGMRNASVDVAAAQGAGRHRLRHRRQRAHHARTHLGADPRAPAAYLRGGPGDEGGRLADDRGARARRNHARPARPRAARLRSRARRPGRSA